MVAAIIISVLLICATVFMGTYMICVRDVKKAKLDLKKVHTQCKHELKRIQLEHNLKKEWVVTTKKGSGPNKASDSDTAAFFKILNDPTLLYEEDMNDGATGDN